MGNKISRIKRKKRAVQNDTGTRNKELVRVGEDQVDAFQIHHHLLRVLWEGNFCSPIECQLSQGNFKVLDVGCGPGTWICDMASDYRNAEFTGLDILSVFPTEKPKNVKFIQGDIFDHLPFPDNSLDFVHMRFMLFSFNTDQWENFIIPELTRVVKPGGWLELTDAGGTWNNIGPIAQRLNTAVIAMYKMEQMDPDISQRFSEIMRRTGQFHNFHYEQRIVPCGSWGGRLGSVTLQVIPGFYEGLKSSLIPIMKVSEEGYGTIVSKFIEETNIYRTYGLHYKHYAQKIQIDNSN